MPSRYYEVIITGRQLATLLTGVVLLIFAAFGLGVAVRLLEPPPVQAVPAAVVVTPTLVPTPEPPAPTPAPTGSPTQVPPPPVAPTTAPTQPQPPVAPETPLPLPPPTTAPSPRPEPTTVAVPAGGVWVQVAAVSRPDLAEGVVQRVMAFGFQRSQLRVVPTHQGLFKVRLGPFPDLESAGRVVGRLQEAGFEGPFIVRE